MEGDASLVTMDAGVDDARQAALSWEAQLLLGDDARLVPGAPDVAGVLLTSDIFLTLTLGVQSMAAPVR